eukprot:TRINITY_DN53353_c0_g1_i1.p1 TRINITY_DN53353_c0_g1~~TRINITY_DN53353_c0_g1_i1.p1  ORF type:complete len:304 (+),score=14.20 TRINITY_DN53353_c0_g1_i1:67-978(+)
MGSVEEEKAEIEAEVEEQGVLLDEEDPRLDAPPCALPSDNIELNWLYRPYVATLVVPYYKGDPLLGEKTVVMGTCFAVSETELKASKHVFSMWEAKSRGWTPSRFGCMVVYVDADWNDHTYEVKITEVPVTTRQKVRDNTFHNGKDYITLQIINGTHSMPIVHLIHPDNNKGGKLVLGGPTPSGGWTKHMLPSARQIAKCRNLRRMPTADSISNAFPEGAIFTCTILRNVWTSEETPFITYQNSTYRRWSGSPLLVLNKKGTDFQRTEDGRAIGVAMHAGESLGNNFAFGIVVSKRPPPKCSW